MYSDSFEMQGNEISAYSSFQEQSIELQDMILNSSESEEESYPSASDKEEDFADISSKHMALRASTAPARPLTDVEEFRRSSDFLLLEHTVICASQLFLRGDQKYDLDSDHGQRSCKQFLNQVEKLCEVYKVQCASREYRNRFSKAYRVLYKENSLCYLTEILDSAQEGFPYLYVNGEKYVFSAKVLQAGSDLFQNFVRLQFLLKDIYSRVCDETFSGALTQTKQEISQCLQEFDSLWVDFEQLYVHELMAIESDARRFIEEAIQLEHQVTILDSKNKEKNKPSNESPESFDLKSRLVTVIGKINSVANIEGKGRDDLTIDILKASEGLLRRMSTQTKCIRNLAEKIRQSFIGLRMLFRKYAQNIEIVDPQLKNNPELVDALVKFESSWERGKIYFLNSKKCNQLVFLSNMIESTNSKYQIFKEQLECSDSELFVSIPALLILKALEGEDRGICKSFCAPMFDENENVGAMWKRLKRSYNLGKLAASSITEYIEVLTALVLSEPLDKGFRALVLDEKFDNLDGTVNKIKYLAIELHRHKPTKWNRFLDIILC
ncbi:hypothetical protein SteCoe_32013 [Stentor coeruleus]|uniref:Uncharacterized protein n=1 Tax=Stentor coeruleus TaxID=5963 RepID=A0A1R2B006_9CILI|nr:hypothetical protein SteCoe_32013 [Stentor coeruleus]